MMRRRRSPASACDASEMFLRPRSSSPNPPMRLSQTVFMRRAPGWARAAPRSCQAPRQTAQRVAEEPRDDQAEDDTQAGDARIELTAPGHQRRAVARLEQDLAEMIADRQAAAHHPIGHPVWAIEREHLFVDRDAGSGDLAHAADT